MPLSPREYKVQFYASEDAMLIRQELEQMVDNPLYSTKTFYTTAEVDQSFVDKHMTYLSNHPKLKPAEYLSNLRLMTKARV